MNVGDRLGSPRTLHTHCGQMRSCTHIGRKSVSQGRGGPTPPHSLGLFRALHPLRVRPCFLVMQRPPLWQRRQRRAIGETAEVGCLPDKDDCYHASASSRKHVPTPWISSSSPPPPPPDSRTPTTPPVSLQPGIQSLPASHIGGHPHGAPRRRLPFALRVDDAFSCHREDDEGRVDGSPSGPARLAGVPPWSPTCTLPTSRLWSFQRSRFAAPTKKPSALTNTAGARLTSSRPSP